MKNKNGILTVIIILIFLSCNKISQNSSKSNIYEEQELAAAMQAFLADTLNVADSLLLLFYEKRDFVPFFIDENGISSVFDEYYSQLLQVENNGLSPEKFDSEKISFLSEKIRQNADIAKDSLALFDYFTVKSYVDLCAALHFGAVNPKRARLTNYYFETEQITPDFVEKCIKNINENLTSYIQSVEQRSENYEFMQKARNYYVALQDSVFEKIPALSEKQTIKFGEKHSSIPLITKRLLLTNEISETDADSALNYYKFDSLLLKSINIFQKKRGLLVDSEIGNSTIRELNVPFKDLIKKIDVNLERMRWHSIFPLDYRFIRVNVANQTLTAFGSDTVALRMKVCVGEELEHFTPFIHSNIYDITLNPLWRVPKSIIIKEIAQKSAPANYIRRNRMKVYSAGVEVNPDSVNWRAINEKFSPYTIVQDSGAFNSLGRIKFNMLNNFSVYLHDTNAKSAFRLHKRSVSHGCVRVEKPLELAYFCLPEMSEKKFELLRDKILFSIERQPISEEGKRLQRTSPNSLRIRNIAIKPQIPVLLEYYTAFVDENGDVAFCNDIYRLDEQLYKNIR
jgi:murein L,D-transpeptidase YcbB/YkuD